jgi:IMP dehydrogenase
MDSVTEDRMAIAMAKAGGIGILHRYLSATEQIAQVRNVKRAEAFIIQNPYTISETATVSQLRAETRAKSVKSLLVTDAEGKLCGIVTNRDMRLAGEMDSRLVKEIMTPRSRLHVSVLPPNRSLTPEEARAVLHEKRIEKLPLVDDKWNIQGVKEFTCLFVFCSTLVLFIS